MWATLRRFPHKWRYGIGIAFGTCAIHFSCSSPEDLTGVLRINLSSRLTSLDPAQATSQSNIWMVNQVFEGLVALDSSLQIRPQLARSWLVEDSGRVYRFRLRSDVRFHADSALPAGRRFRAADIRYTFRRLLQPDSRSSAPAYFAPHLAGADSFRLGLTQELRGVETPDDSTVVFRLNKPFAPFLSLLALPLAAVVPQEAVEAYGEEWARRPVGTGPYRLAYWAEDRRLVLHRNEHYYKDLSKSPRAVEVRFLRDRINAFAEMKLGNLDFMEGVDPAQTAEVMDSAALRAQTGISAYNGPQLTTEYLGLNLQDNNGPLRDKRIRQALSLSIDRRLLAEKALQGMAEAGTEGIVPPGMPAHEQRAQQDKTYNPQKARLLLAEAGYPQGKGLPELTLHTTAAHLNAAQFLQFAWQSTGFRVRIELMEGAALRDLIYQGKSQMWRASWIADYADPENYYSLFWSANLAPDGPNTTRFSLPAFDRVFETLRETNDASALPSLYSSLDSMLAEEAPVIVLYYYRTIRLTSPRVSRFPHSPMNLWLPLHEVRLKE